MKNKSVPSPVEIKPVTVFSREIHQAIQSLLRQLTTAIVSFSETDLKQMIQSENTVLVIAREHQAGGRIIGMLSYATYRIPTGLNFRIEDVVVEQAGRGRGVGRQLMKYALARAKEMKADKIDLTSSPQRIAANQLYQSMGFRLKKTNVYRYPASRIKKLT